MKDDHELKLHQMLLLDFAKNSLCNKPSLWIGNSNFENLCHFYSGYTAALQVHLKIDLLRNWIHWLAKELDPDQNYSLWWGQLMIIKFGSHEKAIQNFPLLIEKYFNSEEFKVLSEQ